MVYIIIFIIVIILLSISMTKESSRNFTNKKVTSKNCLNLNNQSFDLKITSKLPNGEIRESVKTVSYKNVLNPSSKTSSSVHIQKLLDISNSFPRVKDGFSTSNVLEKYILDNYPILLYSEFFTSDDISKVSRKLKKLYTIQDLREVIGDRIDKEFKNIRGLGRGYVFYTDSLISNIQQSIWAYRDSVKLKIKYSQSPYDKSKTSIFSNLDNQNICVDEVINLLDSIFNIDVVNLSYEQSLSEYRKLKPLLDESFDFKNGQQVLLPPYNYNDRYHLSLRCDYD